ncbi:hypothetical protein MCOR23_000325 [Pyricularia oryzae]|nr:hypothetical protein MCOR23_000325 [Pyricularia oryzae]
MRRQTLQTGSKGYAIVNASSKGFFRGGIYAGDLLDNLIVKAATGHGRDSSKETWNQQAKDELMYFFDSFPKGEDNGWQKTLKVEENITPGTVVKVEIGIWAMGVEYEAGEELRFVVSGRSKAVSSFCSNDAVNKNGAYKIDYAVNIRAL